MSDRIWEYPSVTAPEQLPDGDYQRMTVDPRLLQHLRSGAIYQMPEPVPVDGYRVARGQVIKSLAAKWS
jgi:hypothetical protein